MSNFDSDNNTFKWMFRIVASIIAMTFVAMLVFWIFAGTVVVKAVDQVDQVGLKAVVENIWCGKGKSCL